MRLIQQEPAWILHAYLRFLNVDYHTENTIGNKSLGLQLPIIVDKVTTRTESLALSYLSSKYSDAVTEMSADAVFSAYLKQALDVPLQQLRRDGRIDKKNLFRVLPIGLNVAFSLMDDIHEFFCGDRLNPLPGATEDELLESLTRVYAEINESLLLKIAQGHAPTFTQLHAHVPSEFDDEDRFAAELDRLSAEAEPEDRLSPTSPPAKKISGQESGNRSPSKAQRAAMQGGGIAEAVLFGHIASVLCYHEKLATILVRYEGLLVFFQYICTSYFTDPYVEATTKNTDDLHWKTSMDTLLANKFLDQASCEPVKQCLLYGTPIPCTGLRVNASESATLNQTFDFASADEDFYPEKSDSVKAANPLARMQTPSPIKNVSEKKRISLRLPPSLAGCSDVYLVNDEPTHLSGVQVDLSFSAPWRSAYNNVLGVLGYPQTDRNEQSKDRTSRGRPSPLTIGAPSTSVHTMGLGGAVMLLGVTSCFAGYAFYLRKKL